MNHIINQLNRELAELAAYPRQQRLAAARIELAGGRNRSVALIWRQIRDNPEWHDMHSDRSADIRELAELALGDATEAMLVELEAWSAHGMDIDAAAESGNWPSPISDNLAAKCAAESPARAAIIYVGARRRRAVRQAIRAHRGGGHRGGLISPEPIADCRAICESAESAALRNLAYREYRAAAAQWKSNNQSPAHRAAARQALLQSVALAEGELEMEDIPSANQRRAIRRQYRARREIAIAAGIGSEADWGGRQTATLEELAGWGEAQRQAK